MGAKFTYTGDEERVVEVRAGSFTAEPDTTYEVHGTAVPDLMREPDFEKVHPSTEPSEEPTWASRS